MTLLRSSDQNSREINVALLSLEADIKNKITNFDTSVIDRQLAEINNRIDKINAGGGNSSAAINDIRTEIEDINSKLNGNSVKIENIEQKLSDIFSADNKVTDFNTTTASGIYYWVEGSANKPANYGVLLVNKHDGGSTTSLWINQVAYSTDNKIYFRQNINSTGWTEWKAVAFTTDIEKTTTKTLNLNAVSTDTIKYIKLGTFHWNESISFRCRLGGDSIEDVVNINILGGNATTASVCGYYSTNSSRTLAIIVKRGDSWNSDIEIYLQVKQRTTLAIYVTIDKEYQDRINISESTTAPSGKLETINFNIANGMFTSNIAARNLTRIKYADYQTPTQTFTQFQQVPIELSKFSPEVTPNNVLCFMVIYWSGVQLIAGADWGDPSSSGLKCALTALVAGTGHAIIRCVYMV